MRFRDLPRRRTLWAPLTAEEIGSICRRLPGGRGIPCRHEPVYSGRFNTTYRLCFPDGERLILRVAPPAGVDLFRHERDSLRRECEVQPLLAAASPLVPEPIFADLSLAGLPRAYVVQPCLDGELWSDLAERLDDETNDFLWAQLGAQVRRIHGITSDRYGYPAASPRHEGHGEWFRHVIDDLARDLAERNLRVARIDEFRRRLVTNDAWLDHVGQPTLVHGDLWPRNILIRQRGGAWEISGILDAERAFWGEPGAEWIFSFLDIPKSFWEAYGRDLSEMALDPAARLRRRCHEARGALQLILEGRRYGFDTGFAERDFADSLRKIGEALPPRTFVVAATTKQSRSTPTP